MAVIVLLSLSLSRYIYSYVSVTTWSVLQHGCMVSECYSIAAWSMLQHSCMVSVTTWLHGQ